MNACVCVNECHKNKCTRMYECTYVRVCVWQVETAVLWRKEVKDFRRG